jgi:hypothetical protein
MIFLTSKWPSSVRATMVDPSLLAFLPTSTVVQGISIFLLCPELFLRLLPFFPPYFIRIRFLPQYGRAKEDGGPALQSGGKNAGLGFHFPTIGVK